MRRLVWLVGMLILLIAPTASLSGQTATECTFTTDRESNLRAGPGTGFDREGTLDAGESVDVIGRDAGNDGYVWWQTAGGWVRSDLGESDCDSLCGDGICEYGEDQSSCSQDCTGNNGSTNTPSATGRTATSCTFICEEPLINVRNGPGTSFAVNDQITDGDTLDVIGRAPGADGFVWWQGDIGWVRSDLGDSDCDALCGDGVCEYGEDQSSCSQDCDGTNSVVSSTGMGCEVPDCQSCYETISCYPDCDDCTCSTNAFGCTECYCQYG